MRRIHQQYPEEQEKNLAYLAHLASDAPTPGAAVLVPISIGQALQAPQVVVLFVVVSIVSC